MSFVAQNLGRISSAQRRGFSAVVRKNISVEERAALRAARRERANQLIQETTGAETGTTGTASSTKVLTSKYTWYAAVGIPSAILAWGLSDENSPPARLSKQIGLTGLIEDLADTYTKPAHSKLLPAWSQVRTFVLNVVSFRSNKIHTDRPCCRCQMFHKIFLFHTL